MDESRSHLRTGVALSHPMQVAYIEPLVQHSDPHCHPDGKEFEWSILITSNATSRFLATMRQRLAFLHTGCTSGESASFSGVQ